MYISLGLLSCLLSFTNDIFLGLHLLIEKIFSVDQGALDKSDPLVL